jgi:hypothetical protein
MKLLSSFQKKVTIVDMTRDTVRVGEQSPPLQMIPEDVFDSMIKHFQDRHAELQKVVDQQKNLIERQSKMLADKDERIKQLKEKLKNEIKKHAKVQPTPLFQQITKIISWLLHRLTVPFTKCRTYFWKERQVIRHS